MKTTMLVALTAAIALVTSPALAKSVQPVDYSALYGDPTWPRTDQRAPGVALQGSGETDSFLRQDPQWPATSVVAPGLRLDTYRAPRPAGSIDNDGDWRMERPFARLDAPATQVGSSRR
jgi:hypothetical protein